MRDVAKLTPSLVAGGTLIFVGSLLIASLGSAAPAELDVAPKPPVIASPAATVAPSATWDPRTPIPTGYRIQIPRLGIDLPIEEGALARDIDKQQTPERFAFHLPGTSIPGLGSNTYLYAHARAGMFLTLWNAQPGDEVLISTPQLHALRYLVTELHPRVAPDDVSWVQATVEERLTLQTSTGPNPTDPRFVVIAVPATSP